MSIRTWFWLSLLLGPRLGTRVALAYWCGALIAGLVLVGFLALPLVLLLAAW